MNRADSGVTWHHLRIPATIARVVARVGGSTRRPAPLAPQVRGNVPPRVIDALERRGWHVHRIGRAAYVHAPDRSHHFLFGVWPRRSPTPSWSDRLGRASGGWFRRLERVMREQRWRRQARSETGQFSATMPWHRWPTPALYSWDPVGPSVDDQAAALELEARIRRGLAGYPVDAPECELRALAGDR